MKITSYSERNVKIETYTIDYENGFKCNVTLEDSEVDEYEFYDEDGSIFIYRFEKYVDSRTLEDFNDFENLKMVY